MIENIFPDIFFIFLFGIKIGAAILCNLSICKNQFQILILQLIEINFCYMQFSVCSRQFRGGKDFSHRDIDICHAVFKICLFFRIFQLV